MINKKKDAIMGNRMMCEFLLFCLLIVPASQGQQTERSGSFRSFDGIKIHYTVTGKGKPVLLIHGFTGNSGDWKSAPLRDSLLSNGCMVIAPDLRGNGRSDKPNVPEAYADDAEAKDLIGLMNSLDIASYDVVGYSRGSIITARVLVLDPKCKRGVMGGMGADFTDPLWPRRIGFYHALMDPSIKGYDGFRTYIAGKGLDPLVLACQQKEQPSTSKEELAQLRQSVLIVCGDKDADNGKGSELQKLIPHSVFVEITGDHNTSAYTTEFAGAIISFLKR